MPLHRDIYWVGRQWAVTGYGLQLIDQRLRGVFDIEAARLWDQRVLDALRTHDWLKADDFDKAITAAHKRFPEPARPCLSDQAKPGSPVETPLNPSLPAASAPEKLQPSTADLRTDSLSATADLRGQPALLAETTSRPSEPVGPVPPAVELRTETARADLQSQPPLSLETLLKPSEPAAPASPILPLRTESERARADLESKMSALDSLLRSRGFVAPQPGMPPPSMLPMRAEGELAKFAPHWRVRS
jgi:hypothetical protein